MESIKSVADLVSDIAGASLEQSSGVDEVNRALTQMDEVTQQNSALVEENAATAKTLEHQAKTMDERVSFFRIDTRRRGRSRRGRACAAAAGRAQAPAPSRTQGASRPRRKTRSFRTASWAGSGRLPQICREATGQSSRCLN